MNLGIVSATNIEIDILRRNLNFSEITSITRLDFVSGYYNGINITFVVCGIGKVNAALATQLLINKFNISHIIMVGVAGAIQPELKIGDVIISDKVMYHDFNGSLLTRYPLFKSDEYFEADRSFINTCMNIIAVNNNNPRVFVGTIISGDTFISNKDIIDEHIQSLTPYCVDMESASVAHTCYLNMIPYIVIKAISDFADKPVEELKIKNVIRASSNVTKMVTQILNQLS